MKKIVKYILIFILMIIIFCTTLTLTSLIPKKYIEQNVKESSQILNQQTNSLMIKIRSKKLYLMFDNYTDALMINTAYSINEKTPFYSAMVARKNYIEGTTKTVYPDTTGELRSSSKYSGLDQVGDLNDTVNNDTTESFEYARYWHGYLVFLRPLLMIFNITQIRILLFIILGILAIILLWMICKKLGVDTAIIFLLGMFISDYFYMGLSLQGAPVFLICMIASIIIMTEKVKDNKFLFMIIGGLTSFFDFLTVPIITLGIPLLLFVLLKQRSEDVRYKEIYLELIKSAMLWGIGYFGVWSLKWILVDIIYHKEVINSTIQQFFYRSVSEENIRYNVINVLSLIMHKVVKKPLTLSIFITIAMLVYKIIRNKKSDLKIDIKSILVYFVIGMIGISWYTVLANHSYLHYIFTYRNFFLISVCLLLIIYNILNEKKKEN